MTCKYHTLSTMLVILAQLAVPGARAWTRIDYVDPAYVLSHNTSADTTAAQRAIIAAADEAAKNGPWSARSGNHTATTEDPADYLSWAENYWPDCAGNDTTSTRATAMYPTASSSQADQTLYAETTGTTSATNATDATSATSAATSPQRRRTHPKRLDDASSSSDPSPTPESTWTDVDVDPDTAWQPVKPHNDAKKMSSTVMSPSSSSRSASSTAAALATTAAPSAASESISASQSSPSAACPYAPRESTNPDTQSLPGPVALDQGPDGAMYNAIAFALTHEPAHAATAVTLLKTLFVDDPIHPSAGFAGLIRGPGGRNNTPAGLLDFRGLIEVVNALTVLRRSNAISHDVDQGVTRWSGDYLAWLQTSEQGRNASAAEDHLATVYALQIAALQLISKDESRAKSTLEGDFSGPFLKQIDADGRQVNERGTDAAELGLQGVMTAAKIGSSLGLEFWHTKSNAGGTIQSAVDYLMREGSSPALAPHVSVVKAVYGDPSGIYTAWLEANAPGYKSETWYFYDQPEAFVRHDPAKRANSLVAQEASEGKIELHLGHLAPLFVESTSAARATASALPNSSSSEAVATSVASSTATTNHSGTASTVSSSSATVFQTSPGPMPPSPPSEDCHAAGSFCSHSALSTFASSTAAPSRTGLLDVKVENSQEVGLNA